MEFKIDKILSDNDVVYGSDNYETFLNSKFKVEYEKFIEKKQDTDEAKLSELDENLVELFNDLHEIEELDEEIGKEKIEKLKAQAKLKKMQKEKEENERKKREENEQKKQEPKSDDAKKQKVFYEKDLKKLGVPKNKYMFLGLFPKRFEFKDQKFVPIKSAPFFIGWTKK